ncbi:MAG: glycosyl hydrolase-related protein [Thermoguttaceae bacterium]
MSKKSFARLFYVHLIIFSCLFFTATSSAQQENSDTGADKEIIIVFKTHFDIGYTDLAENIVRRYQTDMIDGALDVVDQFKDLPAEQQFVWTLPGWPLYKILEDWEGQTPERKERILKAFKEGRFAVHALPFTVHTETLELEDLIRSFRFSSELCEKIGVEFPRDAKMTDVPSHSWVLPSLLKNAGVEFLHLGCNAASSSPDVPALFWWEGPDGSRILTMYSAAGYGTGIVPPADWPHKTWLALVNSGDNHGPPTPDEVAELFKQAKEKMPGAKVRIGRLSDFSDSLLAEKPELPVIRGDMPDTWIHGPMCDPEGEMLARWNRPLLSALEMLDTELRLWGPEDERISLAELHEKLKKAYEQSLLYGEHTWGGAMYWITDYAPGKVDFTYDLKKWNEQKEAGRFEKLEKSWEDHTNYIREVEKIAKELVETEFENLNNTLNIPQDSPKTEIISYNQLPWKQSGTIWIYIDQQDAVSSKDAKRGDFLDVRMDDIPPLGYKKISLNDEKVKYVSPVSEEKLNKIKPGGPFKFDPETGEFDTPYYSGKIDCKRGAIAELIDKTSGMTLSDPDSPQLIGQLMHEYFDADQVQAYNKAYTKINADWARVELGKPEMPPTSEKSYSAVSPEFTKIFFFEADDTLQITFVSEKSDEFPYEVTSFFFFYKQFAGIDFQVVIGDKPCDPSPEAIWICFPFDIKDPSFEIMRLGGITDPKTDFVPGSNHDMYWTSGGTAIVDPQGNGVGICPMSHGLISLDRPGCWKYSKDFVPEKSNLYVNIYNNQWSTNFRLWNGGKWYSRVRFWGIDHYDAEESLVAPSLLARNIPIHKIIAKTADSETSEKMPASKTGLELSRKGVQLTSLRMSDDEKKVYVRLWELAGKDEPVTITIPQDWNVKEYRFLDLRDRPISEPVPVKDGIIKLDIKKNAPASLELSM